jgi:hypothetical protein
MPPQEGMVLEILELRAEEVRAIAETLRDPEAKALIATVVDTYEKMAERAAVLRGLLRRRPRAGGSASAQHDAQHGPA